MSRGGGAGKPTKENLAWHSFPLTLTETGLLNVVSVPYKPFSGKNRILLSCENTQLFSLLLSEVLFS